MQGETAAAKAIGIVAIKDSPAPLSWRLPSLRQLALFVGDVCPRSSRARVCVAREARPASSKVCFGFEALCVSRRSFNVDSTVN